MVHHLTMLDWLVIKLEWRMSWCIVASSSSSNLPECLAPLSCKQQYHTHPEWSTHQSRSVDHTSVPVEKHRHVTCRGILAATHITTCFFVRVQENVWVAIEEPAIVFLWPMCHLQLGGGRHQIRLKNTTSLELDNTPYLHPHFLPGFIPSWFSLRRRFLYLQQENTAVVRLSEHYKRLTSRSVSDPNSARLLSFQSYFLAFTRPDIVAQMINNYSSTWSKHCLQRHAQ